MTLVGQIILSVSFDALGSVTKKLALTFPQFVLQLSFVIIVVALCSYLTKLCVSDLKPHSHLVFVAQNESVLFCHAFRRA
jgi:hypothetical protein